MSEETLEISFDQIEKERGKYLLIDTRDKVTVEYGMIPGAISVPEQELEERAEELRGDKIPVLYCTRGLFSQEGAEMLREKGIPALSLKGGYTGWLFQQMQKESKKGDSEETENEAMEQRRKDIELSIRKKFHKQLFSRFARGINDYELVKPGDKIQITEYQSYMNYSYIIEPAVAMSGCYPNSQRIKAKEGTIVSVEKAPLSGYVVIAEFEE